jgi:hypothetical protein
MNDAGIIALIFSLAILKIIIMCYVCPICENNAENEDSSVEEEIATVGPSAPSINDTEATADQATFVNDALQVEESKDSLRQEVDFPPAYEDLFAENEF